MKPSDYAPCGCVPLYGIGSTKVEGYVPCQHHVAMQDKELHCEDLENGRRTLRSESLKDEPGACSCGKTWAMCLGCK